MAPCLCLLHEFGHAYNAVTDYNEYIDRKNTKTGDAYGNEEEKFVIQILNSQQLQNMVCFKERPIFTALMD